MPTVVFFTTPGAGTWTIPTDVVRVVVKCIGAGSVGTAGTSGAAAIGGGGGAYGTSIVITVPGGTLWYNVGAVSGTASVADTWCSRASNAAPIIATDGVKATGCWGPQRLGATAGIGQLTYGGGDGATTSGNNSGGGGGAGGPNGKGSNASTQTGGQGDLTFGGAGGSAGGGAGGTAVQWTQTSPTVNAGAGGGGGGATNNGGVGGAGGAYGAGGGGGARGAANAGGNGGAGIVIIEYDLGYPLTAINIMA